MRGDGFAGVERRPQRVARTPGQRCPDFRTPDLAGPLEERPFFVASGDPGDAEPISGFAAGFGDDLVTRPEIMVFDEPWNSVGAWGARCFVTWARGRPGVVLAGSV